jgi:TolB-like protein/DNA-binding winged helix-turn-helix (wHTH) protein/Flp pilus assembly protein TadD
VFEVDLRSGELRKQGLKIKLQGQPIQILALLLERPGELVTREELREKLWPRDTFVDFEHGLNAAIKKLRAGLGDSADNPRFVETLHRRGYRFIAPVEGRPAPPISSSLPAPAGGKPVWRLAAAGFAVVALFAVLVGLNVGGWQERLLGGAAPGQITSLAVLPLENLSGDPEQEYFADGMTDALISDLGKIEALRVISRTSVMQYKQVRKPLPEIARELDVDAVIEGSVLRAGKQVRITVQLMRAEPEEQLWSQSYQRDLSEILALQREVARAIAREIKIVVTPEEETRLAGARASNPGAYEAYLKGRYQNSTAKGTKLAIEYFQQALEKDPNYAPAYAGLAQAYNIARRRGVLPRKEAITRAKAAVEKALEIDPTLGEAHTSLARIRFSHDRDWSGAERAFKRAIELNPNNAATHHWYGHYLIQVGRMDESLTVARRLVEIDPISPGMNAHLGWAYFYARQYDRAIDQYRKALELDPNRISAHAGLGRAYLQKGMHEDAIAEFQKAVDLGGWMKHDLGYAYAVTGKREEAVKTLEELLEQGKGAQPTGLAQLYGALGEKDQAFAWLEKAYEEHDSWLGMLKADPHYDSLRSDPRFETLLQRMNFPE